MSFLAYITRPHQLKKTSGPTERRVVQNRVESEQDYEKLLSEASMENYLRAIEKFTFYSSVVPITLEQCKVLLGEHEKFVQFRQKQKNDLEMKKSEKTTLLPNEFEPYKAWKDENELQQLMSVIQEAIDRERVRKGDQSAGVFVRVSTISPKDAVMNNPNFEQRITEAEQYVRELERRENICFESDLNRRLYALYIAGTSGMNVNSGEEAVQLLLESDRTRQEFESKVNLVDDKLLNIIVREWSDFDVALEFRGFVHNGRFNALTQYNPYIYFPHLVKQRADIEKLVRNFVDSQILTDEHLRHMGSFVIDVLLVLKPGKTFEDDVTERIEDKYDVKIIELNPLGEMCGACCFSFEDDRDQIYGTGSKQGTFEFRMVEELPPFIREKIETSWGQYL